MRRSTLAAATTVAVLLAAGAITVVARPDLNPWAATGPGATALTPGRSAQATAFPWHLTVPATAPTSPGTLTLTADAATPDAPVWPGADVVTTATLATDTPLNLTTPATLTVTVDLGDDQDGSLALLDPATGTWEPLPTVFDDARATATAELTALHATPVVAAGPRVTAAGRPDVLGFITWHIANLAGDRAETPTCDGDIPAWADEVVYIAPDPNNPVLWCAGHDPARPELLTIKLAVNRGTAMLVEPATTPAWTWNSATEDHGELASALAGVGDLDQAVAGKLAGGAAFVPPTAQYHLGFTEDAIRSLPIGTPVVSAAPSSTSAVFALAWPVLLDQVASGDLFGRRAAWLAVTALWATCATAVGDAGADPGQLAGALTGCIGDHWRQVAQVAATAALAMSADFGRDEVARLVRPIATAGRALSAWSKFTLARTVAEFLADMATHRSAFQATVFATIAPTPAGNPTAAPDAHAALEVFLRALDAADTDTLTAFGAALGDLDDGTGGLVRPDGGPFSCQESSGVLECYQGVTTRDGTPIDYWMLAVQVSPNPGTPGGWLVYAGPTGVG